MLFNINNLVKVKLTKHGKRILEEQFIVNQRRFPSVFDEFDLPEEDNEGWSEWQLWSLMNTFGEYCYNGANLPFETTIEIMKPGKSDG